MTVIDVTCEAENLGRPQDAKVSADTALEIAKEKRDLFGGSESKGQHPTFCLAVSNELRTHEPSNDGSYIYIYMYTYINI